MSEEKGREAAGVAVVADATSAANLAPATAANLAPATSAAKVAPATSAAKVAPGAQTRKRAFEIGGWSGVVLIGLTTYLRSRPLLRHAVVVLGGIAIAGVAALLITKQNFTAVWLALPLIIFWLGGLLASDDFEIDLPTSQATVDRQTAEKKLEGTPAATPVDLIDLDLKRLTEYYVINQVQARSSFRWAIVTLLLGSGTILGGIWLFYLRDTPNVMLTAITGVAGIISDVLGATFIYLNRQTQQRSLVYYERLVKTQQVMLAMRLAESHKVDEDRAKAIDRVINNLLRAAAEPDRFGAEDAQPRK